MTEREDFCRAFAKRLKKRRKAAGMTQYDLADATDGEIGRSAIAGYEQVRHEPSAYAVYRMSAALGCSIEDLTGRW